MDKAQQLDAAQQQIKLFNENVFSHYVVLKVNTDTSIVYLKKENNTIKELKIYKKKELEDLPNLPILLFYILTDLRYIPDIHTMQEITFEAKTQLQIYSKPGFKDTIKTTYKLVHLGICLEDDESIFYYKSPLKLKDNTFNFSDIGNTETAWKDDSVFLVYNTGSCFKDTENGTFTQYVTENGIPAENEGMDTSINKETMDIVHKIDPKNWDENEWVEIGEHVKDKAGNYLYSPILKDENGNPLPAIEFWYFNPTRNVNEWKIPEGGRVRDYAISSSIAQELIKVKDQLLRAVSEAKISGVKESFENLQAKLPEGKSDISRNVLDDAITSAKEETNKPKYSTQSEIKPYFDKLQSFKGNMDVDSIKRELKNPGGPPAAPAAGPPAAPAATEATAAPAATAATEATGPPRPAGFLAAIASRGKKGGFRKSSRGHFRKIQSGGALSAEQQKQQETYCKMLKMRVPSPAIMAKMKAEGIGEEVIQKFNCPSSNVSSGTSSPSKLNDTGLEKLASLFIKIRNNSKEDIIDENNLYELFEKSGTLIKVKEIYKENVLQTVTNKEIKVIKETPVENTQNYDYKLLKEKGLPDYIVIFTMMLQFDIKETDLKDENNKRVQQFVAAVQELYPTFTTFTKITNPNITKITSPIITKITNPNITNSKITEIIIKWIKERIEENKKAKTAVVKISESEKKTASEPEKKTLKQEMAEKVNRVDVYGLYTEKVYGDKDLEKAMMYTMDLKRLQDSKKQKEKEIDKVLEEIKKKKYATFGTLGQISGLQQLIIKEENTFKKTNEEFIANYITKKEEETEDKEKERIAKLEKLQQKQDFWNGTGKKELIKLNIEDILPEHRKDLIEKEQMVNDIIYDTRTKQPFEQPKIILDPILGKADIIEEKNYKFRKIFFNILLNISQFPKDDNSLKYNNKGELENCNIKYNEEGKPLPPDFTLSVDVKNKEAYYIMGKADIIEEKKYKFKKIFKNILSNKSNFPTDDNSLKYRNGELENCNIKYNEEGKPLPPDFTLSVDVKNKEAYYIMGKNPTTEITTTPKSGGRRKTKYRRSYAHRFTIKHRGKN